MFGSRQWVYNILLMTICLFFQKLGSKAEPDFFAEPTLEPDVFVPFRLQIFTTDPSSIDNNKDDRIIYQQQQEQENSDNLNDISKSTTNKANVHQEFNNDEIYLYRDNALIDGGRNQLHQYRTKSYSSSLQDRNPVDYVTTNNSQNSRERLMNHHHRTMAFEKHKAHYRNKHRKTHNHKKNYLKYKNYGDYGNDDEIEQRFRNNQKFNGYNSNRQSELSSSSYNQGQLSYYSDSDGYDNSYEFPSVKVKNHQSNYYHRHRPPILHHRDAIIDNDYEENENEHNDKTDEFIVENSRWPHLSRVQYQLYEDEKDEYLPPYIKKYKKRNKQLLELLEGTMPPPSPTIPSYEISQQPTYYPIKKHKKSHHNHHHSHHHHYHSHNDKKRKWIMENLFEDQKANPNLPGINHMENNDDDQYMNDAQSNPIIDSLPSSSTTTTTTVVPYYPLGGILPQSPYQKSQTNIDEIKSIQQNELPADDISISSDEEEIYDIEIPSQTNKNSNSKNQTKNEQSSHKSSSTITDQKSEKIQKPIETSSSSKSTLTSNKFIYHRVDDAPRLVGAGLIGGTKKQRLPFVAITDRRLETSKMRQRDSEQNHLPMP